MGKQNLNLLLPELVQCADARVMAQSMVTTGKISIKQSQEIEDIWRNILSRVKSSSGISLDH